MHSALRNQWGRMPLLVTRTAGNGKVLFLGTDSAWRWRRGVEDKFHYRFWGQVVRWMAHQRHLSGKEGIRLSYSPETPEAGDTVFLQSTVLDAVSYTHLDVYKRQVQYLVRGAKARAVLHGSYLVRLEDLESVAAPVLTHRILTNFQAQSEGVDSSEIIRRLLQENRGDQRRG